MGINWDMERDWKVLAPVFAILIAVVIAFLPNVEDFMAVVFLICTGLVGIYGGIKGKGVKKKDVKSDDTSTQNTLNIPAGMVRLLLGVICIVIGLIVASLERPESVTMLFFGLSGELLGISLPAVQNYYK